MAGLGDIKQAAATWDEGEGEGIFKVGTSSKLWQPERQRGRAEQSREEEKSQNDSRLTE